MPNPRVISSLTFRTFAAVAVLAAGALPAGGQERSRFFPGHGLAPAISADPREPSMGGRLIAVLDPASQFGAGIEGEATIGTSLALFRLSGAAATPTVVLGVQGGVYGRFYLEAVDRHLISTDWTFGVPIFVWLGDDWIRVRYRHMSSHIGDEYIEVFGVERSDYSRDIASVTAYVRLSPHVAVYGGPDVAINVEPNGSGRYGAQGGIELQDGAAGGNAVLFGGVDVRIDQDTDWRPRVNLQTGTLFFPDRPTRLRLLVEFGFGPSRQGEFNRLDETVFVFGLVVER